MENRNIYKTDDFLIITSYLMIIPIALIAWPWIRSFSAYEDLETFFRMAPQVLGPRLQAIILYGTGAVSAQIVGRVIRHGEKQSLEILDTLQFYKNTSISQLASQLDMSESKVTSLVKKMSRVSSLGISVNGDSVSIGSKSEPTMGYSKSDMVQEKVEENTDFTTDFREALKKATQKDLTEEERKEELKKIATKLDMTKVQTQPGGKKFNFILFIILFLTPLWPIALIYAISFAVKQRNASMAERTKE